YIDRSALAFFCRWMGCKPRFLRRDKLGSVVPKISDRFKSQLAGYVISGIVGRGLDVRRPAVCSLDKFRQRLADVTVPRGIVVEVVLQLVGDGGELLKEIVSILFAAGTAWMREQVMDGPGTFVKEFNEDHDAVARNIRRVAKLLYLSVRKR